MKITKLKCKRCSDVIVSKYRHDFVWCKCGFCAIDGGRDYTKLVGNPEDYELIEEEE